MHWKHSAFSWNPCEQHGSDRKCCTVVALYSQLGGQKLHSHADTPPWCYSRVTEPQRKVSALTQSCQLTQPQRMGHLWGNVTALSNSFSQKSCPSSQLCCQRVTTCWGNCRLWDRQAQTLQWCKGDEATGEGTVGFRAKDWCFTRGLGVSRDLLYSAAVDPAATVRPSFPVGLGCIPAPEPSRALLCGASMANVWKGGAACPCQPDGVRRRVGWWCTWHSEQPQYSPAVVSLFPRALPSASPPWYPWEPFCMRKRRGVLAPRRTQAVGTQTHQDLSL